MVRFGENKAANYSIEASPSLISAVTDAVMDEVTAWQNRPLEPCYTVVFMDTIRVNIHSDGAVSHKAVFVALAILPDGTFWVFGFRPMRALSSGLRC